MTSRPEQPEGADVKRYIVELTGRETFSVLVEATNQRDAANKARSGQGVIDQWANGDRTITGVKSVYLDPDARASHSQSVPRP